jgi:hypothetical protein
MSMAKRIGRRIYGLAVSAGLAKYRPVTRRAGFEAREAYAGEKLQRGPEMNRIGAPLVAVFQPRGPTGT